MVLLVVARVVSFDSEVVRASELMLSLRIGGIAVKVSGREFEFVELFDDQVPDVSDLDLDKVTFAGCTMAVEDDASFERGVTDVVARRCRLRGCDVRGIRFENITVENLAISSSMSLRACVFRHVTLKGPIGPFMTMGPMVTLDARMLIAFRESAEAFYREVDWALDISEARFSDVSLHMVPGHLVRRDPATQFLLRRETFRGRDRRDLPTIVDVHARYFHDTPFDSFVAVAPTRSKEFEDMLAGFKQARVAGLVE